MIRRLLLVTLCACCLSVLFFVKQANAEEHAYGRVWGGRMTTSDWERFYHYPYVYYPQNFWSNQYYRSSDSLYYRYPPEMRIPVYNKKWHNYYPSKRPYHSGHHFMLDVF